VKKLSSLSAIFPAYNDGGTIASMISAAWLACRQVTDEFEIIVINDGSYDYTPQILEELTHRYPELHVIHHEKNQGYGGALRSGFAAAKKEWVFYTDGDAQYNPMELTDLVNALGKGVDAVNGFKSNRNDSLARIVIGRVYSYFVRMLFQVRVRDVDCDFRLIPTRILRDADLKSISGAICLEMVKKIEDAGYVFAEVPISHYPRKYGVSQFFVPWRILRTLRQIAGLYWSLVIQKKHLRS